MFIRPEKGVASWIRILKSSINSEFFMNFLNISMCLSVIK